MKKLLSVATVFAIASFGFCSWASAQEVVEEAFIQDVGYYYVVPFETTSSGKTVIRLIGYPDFEGIDDCETDPDTGDYICQGKVDIIDPVEGEILSTINATGLPNSNSAGFKTIDYLGKFVLVGDTIINPIQAKLEGRIQNCEGYCPWIRFKGLEANIVTNGKDRVIYLENSTLKAVKIEKVSEGADFNDYAIMPDKTIATDISDVCLNPEEITGNNGVVAVKCGEDAVGFFALDEGEAKFEKIAEINGVWPSGTVVDFYDGDGIAILETSDHKNYKVVLFDKKDGEYTYTVKSEIPANFGCTRPPLPDRESMVAICDKAESGFSIFSLTDGKELMSYTFKDSNIWHVVPFYYDDSEDKLYLALGNWVDGKGGLGIYSVSCENCISESEGETGGGEEQPGGNETSQETVIHLDAKWNLKGTSEGFPVDILSNVNGVKLVWTYRQEDGEGKWFFWSPDTRLINYADQLGFHIIHEIQPFEGFWIYVENETDVPLTELEE